jgi:large subunit ribosomal protein L28
MRIHVITALRRIILEKMHLEFLWFYGINVFFKREKKMPKVCHICGKEPSFGQSVSHSHKASKKKRKPNLQHVKAQTQSGPKKIWVCTRCLRSGKVAKVL